MIRTVIPFTLFTLLAACGQSIPIQPDGPVAKTASDQPGGLLVGTWLRVWDNRDIGWGDAFVDSLIIMPRDGVAHELTYREKTILLEGWWDQWWDQEEGGWVQTEEGACTETDGIDDYVECLIQKAPTKSSYANGWGRLRIQEDNGRGHIRYDQWQDYAMFHWGAFGQVTHDNVRIFYDKRFIVWDDRLILWDTFDEEVQYVRSTQ